MKNSKLIMTGTIGTVMAALCCFTPLLVILFSAIGLSQVIGYLDIVLLPILVIFIAITAYALWRKVYPPPPSPVN